MLRKALESRLPVILVVNKVDRPDARVEEVVHEVEELFLDLDADEHQIDFPILYCERAGRSLPRSTPDALGRTRSSRCSTRCSRTSPRPTYEEDHPLQALVTNLDASPYLGRLALCRVRNGTIRAGSRWRGAAATARSSGPRSPSCT